MFIDIFQLFKLLAYQIQIVSYFDKFSELRFMGDSLINRSPRLKNKKKFSRIKLIIIFNLLPFVWPSQTINQSLLK